MAIENLKKNYMILALLIFNNYSFFLHLAKKWN